MSQATERILQLLWQGKREEALIELRAAKDRVAAKQQRFQRQVDECHSEMEELKRLEAQSGAPLQPVRPSTLEVIDRSLRIIEKSVGRRQAVIDAAKEVAKNHDGLVSTEEVAKLLRERKVELHVTESRIGTSIGNILYRLPEFKAVGSGLYQYQGEMLELQH